MKTDLRLWSVLQAIKNRIGKLESKHRPKDGDLPVVVDDLMPDDEIMRIRNKNLGCLVVRFSKSVDLFI